MTCKTAIFKGDSEAALDLLVEVCNAKKSPPTGSYAERDLQPFDWTDASPLPSSSKVQGRSPRASPPKGKAAKSARPNNYTASPAAKPSSGTSTPAKPRANASCVGRGSLDGLPRTPVPAGATSKFLSFDGLSREDIFKAALARAAAPSCGSRACPGFFSSPRPSDIPQPTGSLLMRALAVKA